MWGLCPLSLWRGQPWCSNLHRAALAGCQARQSLGLFSIQHTSGTFAVCHRVIHHCSTEGCRSLGQLRPPKHLGLSEQLLQLCLRVH